MYKYNIWLKFYVFFFLQYKKKTSVKIGYKLNLILIRHSFHKNIFNHIEIIKINVFSFFLHIKFVLRLYYLYDFTIYKKKKRNINT